MLMLAMIAIGLGVVAFLARGLMKKISYA